VDLEAWVEWKEWVKGGSVKMVEYPEEIVEMANLLMKDALN
jgi:hypothetical protein